MDTRKPDQNKSSYILASITILFWASGFVFTRIAVKSISPMAVGLLRYGTASIILITIGWAKRIGLPRVRDIPLFLLLGFTGFTFYMISFNKAMGCITAATGSIVTAAVPVLTALFGSLLLHERLGRTGWIAVALEFSGILVLMVQPGEITVDSGILWMVAATVSFAAYNLIQRSNNRGYSPLQSITYAIVGGTLLLMVFLPETIGQLRTADTSAILAVVYMGVFPSTIGFLCWTLAISKARALSDVTNFMFVTPLISTLMERLFIGDAPDVRTIAGGLVVLFGLLLFNNRRQARPIANRT